MQWGFEKMEDLLIELKKIAEKKKVGNEKFGENLCRKKKKLGGKLVL